MDLPSAGEPSRRPQSTRALANPSRLSVAHRTAPGQVDLDPAYSDAETLRQSLVYRAKITKRGERWCDKLMEGPIDLSTFKKALPYLTPRQYADVLHERHLNGHCSYPPCGSPPREAYTAHRRIKISTVERTIREKMGNDEEGFSSASCRVKSNWVAEKLDEVNVMERVGKEYFPLFEQLEGGETESKLERSAGRENIEAKIVPPPLPISDTSKSPKARAVCASRPPEPPDGDRKVPTRRGIVNGPSPSNVADIISNLTIRERPTPMTATPASSATLSDQPPHISMIPAPISTVRSSSPTTSNYSPNRRTSSSLVSAPAKLTSSVLSASRQMGPVPQLSPDSDDEEEEERDWGEGEMGLGWGEETDEMSELFEQARQARDLVREEAGSDG